MLAEVIYSNMDILFNQSVALLFSYLLDESKEIEL